MTRILKVLADGMETGVKELPDVAKDLLTSFSNFHYVWALIFGFVTVIFALLTIFFILKACKHHKLHHIYEKENPHNSFNAQAELTCCFWAATVISAFTIIIFFFSMGHDLTIGLEPLGYIINKKL